MNEAPIVELHSVERRFEDSSVVAVDDIDLTLQAGEFVAITGRSGSGKTTLLNLIGLLDRPTDGRLALFGESTDEMTENRKSLIRAQSVGFVFQDSHLIQTRSAVENVEFALRQAGVARSERRDRAIAALTSVGLGHRIDARPQTLSGGERQRVALARAICHSPRLLLCDEPTGNLDSANARLVLDLIERAPSADCTVIVATHDQAIASSAQRNVRLSDGKVVADCATAQTAESSSHLRVESTQTAARRSLVDYLDDVGLNVIRRPGKALVSSFGTFLGIAILVFAIAMTSTADAQIEREFDLRSATEVRLTGNIDRRDLNQVEVDDRIEAQPGVERAGRRFFVGDFDIKASPVPWVTERRTVRVRAVSAGAFDFFVPEVSGESITRATDELNQRIAVLGRGLVNDFANPPTVGSTVTVAGRSFLVIGILEDADRSPDALFDFIVPVGTAATVWPERMDAPEVVVEVRVGSAHEVAKALPFLVSPEDPSSLIALVPPEASQLREAVTSGVDNLVVALVLALLVASTLGIASSNLAGVLERQHELGLRRAFGTTRFGVGGLIMGETAATGALAALFGLVVGLSVALAIAAARSWAPVVPAFVLLAAPALGLVVGLVSGAVPAVYAARVDPIIALRR